LKQRYLTDGSVYGLVARVSLTKRMLGLVINAMERLVRAGKARRTWIVRAA
jgi:hypothetical protein